MESGSTVPGRAPGVVSVTPAVTAAERTPGPHFQLYARGFGAPVRWRLLSGNNRDLGRAATEHPNADECRAELAELVSRIDDCQGVVRPAPDNRWGWLLRHDGQVVATSGHNHDRQIRCERALALFLAYARTAVVDDVVMFTAPRRPSNSGRTDGLTASRASGPTVVTGTRRLGPRLASNGLAGLPVITRRQSQSSNSSVELG